MGTTSLFKRAAARFVAIWFAALLLGAPLSALAQQTQTNLPTLQQQMAAANNAVADPPNFDPVETDVSIRMLKTALGDWTKNEVTPLFGRAMFVFNMAVMVFAAALFTYVSVSSIAMAAHDGTLVGKGRSSLWIPARLGVGAALIFPTATGLSLAQLGLLWLITQGVGIANNSWNAGLEGLVSSQGNVIAVRLAEKGAIRNTMFQMLASEVCVADLNNRFSSQGLTFGRSGPDALISGNATGDAAGADVGGGGRIRWGLTSGGSNMGFTDDQCGQILIPSMSTADRWAQRGESVDGGKTFGKIIGAGAFVVGMLPTTWSGIKEGNARIQKAQIQVIKQTADDVLKPAAEQIAKLTDSTDETNKLSAAQLNSIIDAAAQNYVTTVGGLAQAFAQTQNKPLTDAFTKDSTMNGWATAGAWFYQLARLNGELSEAATWAPEVVMPPVDAVREDIIAGYSVNETDRRTATYAPAIRAYMDGLFKEAQRIHTVSASNARVERVDAGSVSRGGSIAGALDTASNATIGKASEAIAKTVGYDPYSEVHPIVQLKNIGDYTIGAIEAAYVASKVKSIPWFGSKIDIASKIAGIQKLLKADKDSMAYYMGIALAISVIVYALLLAFWIPILPFVIWIGQVLGWLISVFELLVATPIWVAAHLHPDGDGIAGQHAASGYKVLLEILARPVLMIFGLIVTMIILTPFMQFFATLFFNAYSTMTADTIFGLVTGLAEIFLYGALCWMTLNLVLNAIGSVPNGIMRVIGGMEGTNMRAGQEMAQGAKSGFMVVGQKVVSAHEQGKAQLQNKKHNELMQNRNATDGGAPNNTKRPKN